MNHDLKKVTTETAIATAEWGRSGASPLPALPTRQRWIDSRLARWGSVFTVAALVALGVALASGNATYEERLVDIAAGQSVSREVMNVTRDAPELRALFADLANDRELTLKMLLAIEKYGDAAKDVLIRFGHLPAFQAQLRDYGERMVPVVAYFVKNDVASLRTIYEAKNVLNAGKDTVCQWLGGTVVEGCQTPAPPKNNYNETTRGLYAIDTIDREKHGFLAQFDIDKDGNAHWNQTQRVLGTAGSLLLGSVGDLERKYHLGDAPTVSDYAWAGADVLVVFSAAKALKFLKAERAVGSAAKEVSILERTTLLGQRVLLNDKWGKRLIKYGAYAGTGYLVATHPGLLTSLFAELGKMLGLPAFLSAFLGWFLVACLLALVLLPLLPGLLILVPVVRGTAKFSYWLMARKNLNV